jgi:hypothetical protein
MAKSKIGVFFMRVYFEQQRLSREEEKTSSLNLFIVMSLVIVVYFVTQ